MSVAKSTSRAIPDGSEEDFDCAMPEESLRDYVRSLPPVFHGDPAPPVVEEEECVRLSCAALDRPALLSRAQDAERLWRHALFELMEQELALSSSAAEARHLAAQLGEREEDVEVLRVQLQAADDYSEALLREKADALRTLTEAKNELARVGARAAHLQRDLDARLRRETELTDSLVRTPRTTAADPLDRAAQMRKEAVLRRAALLREGLPGGSSPRTGGAGGNSSRSNAPNVPNTSNTPNAPNAAGEEGMDWPHLFLDSVRQNERLEREVLRLRTEMAGGEGLIAHTTRPSSTEGNSCSNSNINGNSSSNINVNGSTSVHGKRTSTAGVSSPSSAAAGEVTRVRLLAQELQRRLRRSTTDLERAERDLAAERERTRRQSRLELQLLKDVGRLARKLRVQESTNAAQRTQRNGDAVLSPDAPHPQEGEGGSEAQTEHLAAALHEALTLQDALRAERDGVRAERRMREIGYEAELRGRCAEMAELAAALNELRAQVALLRQRGGGAKGNAETEHIARGTAAPVAPRRAWHTRNDKEVTDAMKGRVKAVEKVANGSIPAR